MLHTSTISQCLKQPLQPSSPHTPSICSTPLFTKQLFLDRSLPDQERCFSILRTEFSPRTQTHTPITTTHSFNNREIFSLLSALSLSLSLSLCVCVCVCHEKPETWLTTTLEMTALTFSFFSASCWRACQIGSKE